jgi:hypothetical protein
MDTSSCNTRLMRSSSVSIDQRFDEQRVFAVLFYWGKRWVAITLKSRFWNREAAADLFGKLI